ncbi:nuclear transport factor 2 family protein [Psychromarinibacter sp. S121]|uniref:nuclear transport factor 2 family protein n=1 Tax=Psychromarinibacter sp. S121 TaxID=3415127 RepID=UPI003C7A34EB
MTISDPRGFVSGLYADRLKNDPVTIANQFTEDAGFAIVGRPLANSAAVSRPARMSVTDMAQQIVDTWEWRDIQLGDVLAEGDLIVTRYEVTARHVPTGREITTEIVDFLTVKNGKVTDMRQYTDTAYLGEVVCSVT